MSKEALWQHCLEEAARRVEAVKAEYPGCEDAVAFDVGGSSSTGSSRFERVGTSRTTRRHEVPPTVASGIEGSVRGSEVPDSVTSGENAWMNALMSLSDTSHSGTSVLDTIKALVSGTFTGADGLKNIIARNPYSTDYENATAELYNRSFNKARAAAQSGPSNVRGGQSRTGIELAELDTEQSLNRFREVRGQQDKEANVVMNAIQLNNMVEQLRRGQQMQAVQADEGVQHSRRMNKTQGAELIERKRSLNIAGLNLAAQVLGIPIALTTDNLRGHGNQASSASNWGVGVQCCFIFLEALNGRLPEYVRLGRDKFNTPNRRAGYKWMSTWLVPLMRRSKVVLWLTNTLMVRPFLYQGFSHFVLRRDTVFKPLCYGWFYLWSFLGWCGLNGEPENGQFLDRLASESR